MIDPALPLIDLHRHLDGNVRLETILDLGERHGLDLPGRDVESLRPHVCVQGCEPDVMAFIARFKWMREILVDADACRRIAYENVEDAQREGIDYLELRFSPWFMAERHGLRAEAVVEAVLDGLATGTRDFGVPVGAIGIISRTYGPAIGMQELEALLGFRDRIVALDLAGDEAAMPAGLFAEHFRRGRAAGWRLTAHAGEMAGPQSIRDAVETLGVTRIGHAVRLLEDPAVVQLLLERGVAIEANITSNVQTSAVSGYGRHPLRTFYRLGLTANINTDDPGISGIDLPYEYRIAAPLARLTSAHTRRSQEHALAMAFVGDSDRTAIRARALARLRAKHGTVEAAPRPEGGSCG